MQSEANILPQIVPDILGDKLNLKVFAPFNVLLQQPLGMKTYAEAEEHVITWGGRNKMGNL